MLEAVLRSPGIGVLERGRGSPVPRSGRRVLLANGSKSLKRFGTFPPQKKLMVLHKVRKMLADVS